MLKAVSSKSTQEETEEVKIPFQSVSEDIWGKKYRLKSKKGDFVDKNINDTYERVAKALADVEKPGKREFWHKEFLEILYNLIENDYISCILKLLKEIYLLKKIFFLNLKGCFQLGHFQN